MAENWILMIHWAMHLALITASLRLRWSWFWSTSTPELPSQSSQRRLRIRRWRSRRRLWAAGPGKSKGPSGSNPYPPGQNLFLLWFFQIVGGILLVFKTGKALVSTLGAYFSFRSCEIPTRKETRKGRYWCCSKVWMPPMMFKPSGFEGCFDPKKPSTLETTGFYLPMSGQPREERDVTS